MSRETSLDRVMLLFKAFISLDADLIFPTEQYMNFFVNICVTIINENPTALLKG